MPTQVRIASAVVLVPLLLLMSGCGGDSDLEEPELGQVSGVVTLDGAPAAGVQVIFAPKAASAEAGNVGGISTAETDANGQYVLTYKDGNPGAAIGQHLVQVMRPEAMEPNADGSVPPPAGPPIPAKYGMESTEVREVMAGENEINFDLVSE